MSVQATDVVARFADAAKAYCTWAESDGQGDEVQEAREARRLIVALIGSAIELPEMDGDADVGRIGDDDYRRVYMRFKALPFNLYSEVLDPLEVPAEKPGVADLADDLADIWRDLKPGVLLFQTGEVGSAVSEWRFNYSTHWGHHATGALYALQSWLARNDQIV